MVHTFALEPELVASWGNKSDYRFFIDKFGLGTPRVALEYPRANKWKSRVLRAAESAGDMELQRVTALVSILTERMAKFTPAQPLDGNISWFENAEQERISPIIARNNPRNNPNVLICSALGDVPNCQWDLPQGKPVTRKAREMAGVVQSLLSNCSEVIFVDPHFGPENARYRRPFQAFFRAILEGRRHPLARAIVITSTKAPFAFFKKECEERLPRIMPPGFSATFLRLREIENSEKLHNRYILTDIGGVRFDIGLDDGNEGETDDVTILSREQYALRWSQYAGDRLAFDIADEPLVITGIG